ncbi:SusC/RagA family TonB-linked outer membrane protein [Butyricimonas synergistica]|uniref:SusC/RagA family TonB-linked outer membrane protein n=1 Tax=Butyricimonas synergistica TaxID=544644 RepID=UPI0003A2CB10|nr:SusC/RagA family TonB-linked outer membrane protein [Butyricimonas synergistica]
MKKNHFTRGKGRKKMVWKSLFLVFYVFASSFGSSGMLSAQTEQRVTLSMKQVLVEQVFKRLQETTRYRFTYLKEDLPNSPRKDYEFKDASISEVMDELLKGTKLQWKFQSGAIVVSKAKETPVARKVIQRVRGRVVDAKNVSIPGVTVQVLGEYRGTTSDTSGHFVLKDVFEGSKIEFSFIGYEKKTLTAKSDMGTVILDSLAYAIEEVTVINNGIFTRPKENFTGAATQYTGEDIRAISKTSILSALKVLDASFQMPDDVVNGSNPNVLPKVQLRGTNSIMQTDMESEYGYISNPPLIIIDGFESDLQTLFDMSPNIVKSVTLLKDAAATAIYGSKSANGVLVVETIQPEEGATQVFYTGTYGVNIPDLSSFNLMNARQKLEVEELGGYYRSRDFTEQKRLDDLHNLVKHNVARGINTYWLSQPLRTEFTHSHTARVSYGTKKVLLQGTVNYSNNGGIMKGSYRDVLGGDVRVKYTTLNKKLSFQYAVKINSSKGSESPYGDFGQYARMNPYWLPKDENGNVTKYVDIYPTEGSNGLISSSHTPSEKNPLWNAHLNMVNTNSSLSIANELWSEVTFVKGLKLNTTFTYTHGTTERDNFVPGTASEFFTSAFSERGSYTKNNGKTKKWQLTSTLNYGRNFGNHTIYISAGAQLNHEESNSFGLVVKGFPNDRLDDLLFGLQYSNTKPSGSYSMKRTAGFYGNLSYAYGNRYLLDGSIRADGSSVFGRKKRFGDLGSVGIGWNFHNEKFMLGQNVISQLKFRVSWGFTGSVNFPAYAGATTYKYQTDGRYLDFIPATLMGLGNTALKWQQTQKWNYGVDFGLFKGRVTANFNYYRETTDDLIMSTSTVPSNGFDSYHDNLGKSQNVGFDLGVRVVLLQAPKRELYWSVATSFYHNENKLLEITDNLKAQNQAALNQQITNGATTPVLQYVEGASVSGLYAVRSLGIDASNGYEVFLTKDGRQTYVWRQEDMVYMGDMQPKLNFTIYNNFQYKWIRLNFGLTFRTGGVLYNSTLASKVENFNLQQNMDKRVLKDRWTTPGKPADYKGLVDLEGYTRTEKSTKVTSRFVQKANSFEITGLTIDPGILVERWLNRFVTKAVQKVNDASKEAINSDRFSVSFSMQNVLRISSMKRESGTSYPFNRSFLFTLSARL